MGHRSLYSPDTKCRSYYLLLCRKLAQILYTYHCQRTRTERDGVTSITLNPGPVNSDIWRSFLFEPLRSLFKTLASVVFLNTDQGASTSIAAATDPLYENSGDLIYLTPFQKYKLSLVRLHPEPYLLVHGQVLVSPVVDTGHLWSLCGGGTGPIVSRIIQHPDW